jgi:hypothetical protein
MGRRFKGYRPPPSPPPPDHAALFVMAGRKIVLNAGLLAAYRRGSGLLLRTVRTHEARTSLAAAVANSVSRFSAWGREAGPHEHAGRMAMCEYLGRWWTTELRDAPPDDLGEGDAFFARETVRAITERWEDAVADVVG